MAFPSRTSRSAALLVAILAAAGCADENRDRPAQAMARADTTAALAPPESAAVAANNASTVMQDPQVASIVSTSDSVEVAISQLAMEKATSPQVREFAQRMVRDHNASRLQSKQLFTGLGLVPLTHPTAQQIATNGERAMNDLQGQSGAAFDRAFIDFQVTHHETMLGALDNTMIPVTTQDEMETLLRSMRTAIAAHLQQARQIQAGLAREGADTTGAA